MKNAFQLTNPKENIATYFCDLQFSEKLNTDYSNSPAGTTWCGSERNVDEAEGGGARVSTENVELREG